LKKENELGKFRTFFAKLDYKYPRITACLILVSFLLLVITVFGFNGKDDIMYFFSGLFIFLVTIIPLVCGRDWKNYLPEYKLDQLIKEAKRIDEFGKHDPFLYDSLERVLKKKDYEKIRTWIEMAQKYTKRVKVLEKLSELESKREELIRDAVEAKIALEAMILKTKEREND